ncbi:DUF4269 domain-containing protein [Tissierella sp.]|uniref:DUF4269 domain-containing protein n=1 Tax=Tissierella sp. TaxID=41274 RepID=UPI002865A24B|nr:DUF4269 domain-containing protein [Tissierella sp.]MDR7856773.1 DUF4269 domain-containing protein [Tissierella sp.]
MKKLSHDFLEIEYLKSGNIKQQEVYKVLEELNIIETLDMYNPILVGTIPIEIDLPESDLDIICEVYDFVKFEELLKLIYGSYKEFDCRIREVDGIIRVVCNFIYNEWMFEIFGQAIPTVEQNAYKHMIIEHKILNVLSSKARETVISLKKNKLKTEPAFGELLNIDDDPYIFLLEMYDWTEEKLIEYLSIFI